MFDLDDTLFPEREFVSSGFRAVAQWLQEWDGDRLVDGPRRTSNGFQWRQCFEEMQDLYEAGLRGDIFDQWVAAQGISAELVPEMVRVYREHPPQIRPFPEVPDLLGRLRQRFRLGIVSDGYLQVQQGKLAALDIRQYFDAIVFSDSWGRSAWKPSTRPFVEVIKQLGVSAQSAVYVADNPTKDFLGAREGGLRTIWIRRTDGEYTHLEPPEAAHAPDLTVNELNELEPALMRLQLQRK